MSAAASASWRAFGARFAIALVTTVAIVVVAIGASFWYVAGKVAEIPALPIAAGVLDDLTDGPAEAANYLVVGSDTREFVESEDQVAAFGDVTDAPGQRSDTLMVIHVDPESESAAVVSFPRDLWVTIPGRGESRINSAYNDGPEVLIETMRSNFDIPVHHYLEVDFAGFKSIVGAMEGVEIYFPTPARDETSGLGIYEPGCHALDGRQALAYVRSRGYQYYDAESDQWRTDGRADLGRIQRQQYFLRSLADSAIRRGARNPFTAKALLDQTVPNLKRDEGLGLSQVLALVGAFQDLDPERVPMETIPNRPTRIRGMDVLLVEEDAADPILDRIRRFGPPEADDVGDGTPEMVDPVDVSVRVRNGVGVTGLASEVLDALTGYGFLGTEATDADRYGYATTEVRHAPGARAEAATVLAHLGGAGALVEVASTGGVDVDVVIGADFSAVADPADAPDRPDAAPTTTSTTVLPAPPVAPIPGDPAPYGLPPAEGPDGLPLVGCPDGT